MARPLKKEAAQENAPAVENAATGAEAAAAASSAESAAATDGAANPAAESAETPKEATALAGKVVYVGPPIRGTLLHTFAVFSDGIPEEYREHPTLKHLFAAPERLDEARAEIARTGSLRSTYYRRALEEMNPKEAE